jgi:hypothetical protein
MFPILFQTEILKLREGSRTRSTTKRFIRKRVLSTLENFHSSTTKGLRKEEMRQPERWNQIDNEEISKGRD